GRRLLAEELGELPLQLLVERQGAGEEPRAGARGAEVVQRGARRLLQPGVLRQAEVVVRAGDHHLLAVDRHGPAVLGGDRLEVRVHPGRGGLVGAAEGVGLGERVVGPLARCALLLVALPRTRVPPVGTAPRAGRPAATRWAATVPRACAGASLSNPTAPRRLRARRFPAL